MLQQPLSDAAELHVQMVRCGTFASRAVVRRACEEALEPANVRRVTRANAWEQKDPGGRGQGRVPASDRRRMRTSTGHDSLKSMFKRSLVLPEPGVETFFLWGPSQSPVCLDTDNFGRPRERSHHRPGPFEVKASRRATLRLWPVPARSAR